ncbi:MAG: hypothetical protein BWX55_01095 [Deltaproteobacteria bacterium ADurb.Bin022]|nr:MAG: hypothetical protein BWX55_01095 [Deltaproteobacteria bacterium ADurb.Bin022]
MLFILAAALACHGIFPSTPITEEGFGNNRKQMKACGGRALHLIKYAFLNHTVFITVEPVNVMMHFRMLGGVNRDLNRDNAFRFLKSQNAPAMRIAQNIFVQQLKHDLRVYSGNHRIGEKRSGRFQNHSAYFTLFKQDFLDAVVQDKLPPEVFKAADKDIRHFTAAFLQSPRRKKITG